MNKTTAPKAPDHLREDALDRKEIFKGHLLHVVQDRVRLPNAREAYREYVLHPGAVMIVPLIMQSDGAALVVMERQYRHPVGQVMLEFPAGKLDPGEDPVSCGQRELREETGYVANEWAIAGQLHPCIGYSNEVIHVHFARGLQAETRQLDDEEFLDVFTAHPDEVMDWCKSGLITDGKTLTACLWLNQWLKGEWPLEWMAVAPSRP